MRIGIDARLYGTYGRGIGQYLKHLIAKLEQLDTTNEYVIFVSKNGWDEYTPHNPRFQKMLTDIRLYTFKEQWLFPLLMHRAHIDCMHFPHFTVPLFAPQPYIVTIHDMIIHTFPSEYATKLWYPVYLLKLFGYKTTIRQALRRAERVIAVSHCTRDDILFYYPHMRTPCDVIYEGVDPPSVPNTQQLTVAHRFHLTPQKYIFYIGAAYPHKNLHTMINSYMIACERNASVADYPFVIAGREDFFHAQLKKWVTTQFPQYAHRIQWVGEITDQERSLLYANTALFMYITRYEGFGLPVLEAMSYGAPVLVSDRGSLPEIAQDAALHLSPDDPETIANTIIKLLSNQSLSKSYQEKGINQSKKFSWERCAQQTLACYQQIHRSKR